MSLPNCPKCKAEYTYEDSGLFVCPMCHHEWNENSMDESLIKDVHGNILNEGDSVVVIKDLKIKGASTLKQNTTIKNIRLRQDFDENVLCKVDGMGTLYVKSEYLKKI